MSLLGQTFDGQQIFGLVSLLSLLALWIVVLGREHRYARWFRQWEADRKSSLSANEATKRKKTGPWG